MTVTCTTPLLPTYCKLQSVEEMVPDNFFYRFELQDGSFKSSMPGQFVEVWYPGVGETAISICSGKVTDTLELFIRRVGRVTTSLPRAKAGQVFGLRGPFGRGFPVDHFKGKNLCLVAGGCGVAPIRGLWQYLLERRADYGKICVVYGMRRPADMLFKDEFSALAARADIDLFISSESFPAGETTAVPMMEGLVTVALAAAPVTPDYQIAVCGPPVMYRFVVRDLRNRDIPDENMWLSLERHMKCGIGKCGHCYVGGKFACKHGPVFSLDELKCLPDTIEAIRT